MGLGMGFIKKALFIATGGLSGLVWKDDSKKGRKAKAAEKQVSAKKQPTAARARPKAARRPKKRAARTSKGARAAGNATAHELEQLANLHRQGELSSEEFAAAKAKVLGTSPASKESDRGPATYPAVETNVAAARQLADLARHDRGTRVATISSD